jgi:hypothetical protein
MNESSEIICWLLDGDVSIQYQVKRDLLNASKKELDLLQCRIPLEGWCKKYLSLRDNKTGQWRGGLYLPKWISTHYTLLELKNLCIPKSYRQFVESSIILLDNLWNTPGTVFKKGMRDICVGGMILSICSYAKIKSPKINEIIDYIIAHHLPDGGWNCRWQKGDKKSSVHTTLTILECIRDLELYGYAYRADELNMLKKQAQGFLLMRNLYKSLSTCEAIKPQFLLMPYPCRWKYDILRALDYFQSVNAPYDNHMQDAINIITSKRRQNGKWSVNHRYGGLVHFDMEKAGQDSRWNTLRVLRVLKKYCLNYDSYD